jgi:hypothetical protein
MPFGQVDTPCIFSPALSIVAGFTNAAGAGMHRSGPLPTASLFLVWTAPLNDRAAIDQQDFSGYPG